MATNLTTEEASTLDQALQLVLDKGLHEFEKRVSEKTGAHIKPSLVEQAGVRGAKLVLDMAKNYSPERKLEKFVELSNKLVPKLTNIFREEAILKIIPAEVRDEKIAALAEKAGAKPVAELLRKAIATPSATK